MRRVLSIFLFSISLLSIVQEEETIDYHNFRRDHLNRIRFRLSDDKATKSGQLAINWAILGRKLEDQLKEHVSKVGVGTVNDRIKISLVQKKKSEVLEIGRITMPFMLKILSESDVNRAEVVVYESESWVKKDGFVDERHEFGRISFEFNMSLSEKD